MCAVWIGYLYIIYIYCIIYMRSLSIQKWLEMELPLADHVLGVGQDSRETEDQYSYKKKILDWGFKTFLENFELEGINDESFRLLDDETIKALIPQGGPRLIFKNKLRNWLSAQEESSLFVVESTSTASTDTWDSGSIYSYIPDEELIKKISNAETPIIKRKSEEDSPIPATKRICSAFSQGLEAVLSKYPDGQLVLLSKKKLTNDLRTKLVRIVITELFAVCGTEIRGETFLKVAAEIAILFPAEHSETYFIAYNSTNKTGPRGKLYTKYINTKAALKLANASLANTSSNKENVPLSPIRDDDKQYLNFLKIGTEPISKVFEAWENTYRERRKIYMNCALSKIYEDFPCLRTNSGLELIETDFNRKFPESSNVIYSTWQQVSSGIIEEARERKINVCTSDTDLSAKALLCLPFLFSPVTIKRTRKGSNWRPSRSEVQESFFFYISNLTDLHEKITHRKAKLEQFGLSLQPFCAITGEVNKPTYIIVVDDVRYVIDSGVRAVELLYKLYHALDVEYPNESEPLWFFIEELVFKMKPKKTCPSTATVVADVSFHFEK